RRIADRLTTPYPFLPGSLAYCAFAKVPSQRVFVLPLALYCWSVHAFQPQRKRNSCAPGRPVWGTWQMAASTRFSARCFTGLETTDTHLRGCHRVLRPRVPVVGNGVQRARISGRPQARKD